MFITLNRTYGEKTTLKMRKLLKVDDTIGFKMGVTF